MISVDDKKRAIVAPVGAFGNHLRWLMMLSHGEGRVDKEFIISEVYPRQRSWHNWLAYEWKFRKWQYLDDSIAFTHTGLELKDDVNAALFLTCDPKLCFRSYVKFNSSLNNFTIPSFIFDVEEVNLANKRDATARDNSILLDSAVLYNDNLDREFYETVTDFFGLRDAYQDAAEIHRVWFGLHQKSETDMLRDLAGIFNQTYDTESDDLRISRKPIV